MHIESGRCRFMKDNGTQCTDPVIGRGRFCDTHSDWYSVDIEVFKIVTDHFKQDLREFWHRSNFYLIAQAALFSVFVAIHSVSTHLETAVSLVFTTLGLAIAIFWFLVARGCIAWIQRWRKIVIELDNELDRFKCYSRVEALVEQKPFLSPSYITQLLPLVFVIAWLAMFFLILMQIWGYL